jgi:polar amino acid transport system substrate-binding protein
MLILRRGLLALLCIAAISAPVAAQDALARIRAAGSVRVGFPNQVPYAYADESGALTGADAEVARLVFARMGIKTMDGVLTEFAALIPGLRANRFDTVLAMFVTPARCAQVAFSEPIYAIGQGMVVKTGNPAGITGYDDFAHKPLRLAVMAGAAQSGYAKALGIPEDRVVAFPDGPSAMAAVSAGRADAFGISDLPARRLLATAGASSGLQLVPGFPDPVIDGRPARGYDAFAFRPADTSLRDAFNAALTELKDTPQFLAAMAPFGFTQANLPDRTTQALCH